MKNTRGFQSTFEKGMKIIDAEIEAAEIESIKTDLDFHNLLIGQLNDLSKQRDKFTKDVEAYQAMLDSTNKEFNEVLTILMDVEAYGDLVEAEDEAEEN